MMTHICHTAFEERPGSHDIGDPLTTNLYVGNINPAVSNSNGPFVFLITKKKPY